MASLAGAGLLALGLLVAWQLGLRSELALVLWGWVMNASVVVMALTFAATARWAPLRGFDLWLTVSGPGRPWRPTRRCYGVCGGWCSSGR
ncbi:MAG: hypothetical protein IPF99_27140 [Deltaproteobacteria bacterium]|nr:hypothetical protein [Deltaproteobacteria bacterium]